MWAKINLVCLWYNKSKISVLYLSWSGYGSTVSGAAIHNVLYTLLYYAMFSVAIVCAGENEGRS